MGTVIRLSTSVVDKPGASVWISTKGGANSGNTSSGSSSAERMPTTIKTIATAMTRTRKRSEVETSHVISSLQIPCRRVPPHLP